MNPKAHRLPKQIRPLSYAIDIATQPERPDFSGRVSIELEVQAASAVVEMHARELELSAATLETGGATMEAAIELDPARQIVRFTPKGALPAGRAKLEVAFKGKLNPSMHGIYLATDGRAKVICTQCEATDARAIFPCFDEPEFKAQLKWTIDTPEALVALSNGPLESSSAEGGVKRWRFSATRPVSSYLAALVVGDLEGSETKTVNDIPLRIWAPRGKLAQTPFALEFTARLLPWYERYFGVPYPFTKYDQVAVPGFDAGAMENIGLVLFRQNLLLMDPGTASWRQEKMIAKVIAHEFAHMWFGNLVTMKWWDDLWLNEAFAEWMAHKATHAMSPDYRVWDDFQDDRNRALIDDGLSTTHSIYTAVETPDQAIEMFDVITYQKGCAVMRMLEHFLGEEPFMNGLRSYMKTYGNKNAAGPDLWRELEGSSQQPVGELMRSWVNVAGFPLIDLSLDGTELKLTQRRFFSSPKAPSGDPTTWNIPLVARFEDAEGLKEHRFIMKGRDHSETLPARGAVAWCYANAGEIGFYRQRPSEALRTKLLTRGLHKLSAVEQMGFLEDQWALVRNGSNTIEGFLEVLGALAGEHQKLGAPIGDHNVLRAVVDRLGSLDLLLKDSGDVEARKRFRSWVGRLLKSALEPLGFVPKAGESQNDTQRRPLLLHALGRIGRDPEVQQQAIRLADQERADPKSVDPNLAGPALGISAMLGDEARHGLWVSTYRARKDAGAPPQTMLRYLYTLADFRPPELVQKTLALVDDGTVPQEAVSPVMGQLLGARHTQELAWPYVQANWSTLKKRCGDMGLSRVVEAVGALKPIHRGEIVEFFKNNPPAGAERALARALENMDEREELRQRITPGLLRRFAG